MNKSIMSLKKTYQPAEYEKRIYKEWEESGAFGFKQSESNGLPFVTVLPPPNANADLHLGYALDSQLKDVLGRWRRLNGHPVLLLPGADHAGFETWAVYEKYLNSIGKSRFDFDREELYRQVYDFVIKNKANMENQIRQLGISCDWRQFTFTLDKKIVNRSYETFKQMWREDLIYRGKRLVNYCVLHGTGFSDFEVTHKEISGKLYFIKYPLKDSPESFLTIATTRPETLLGDVAVAVHPNDKRYLKFHGQSLLLPLTNRQIPLLCDERVVSDFGSGALKITPAHDFLDFEIAQSFDLKPIEVIDKNGRIIEPAPAEFQGKSTAQARDLIVERLKELGYLLKIEDYVHQVGHCYKCDTVLEPLLADQWFVRMKPLAEKAIEKLKRGAIKFYPSNKGKELITYLGQLQDWNISRQIAWGIPIPVFQNCEDENDWIFDEQVEQKTLTINGKTYKRDPDVFDTWWSSGQWPFATVDCSEGSQLYPQALMETGVDILRPWVSRMIILSLFVTKKLPFKVVYLHGMIVDEKGVKMSKSKGNVVDPMTIIETYGADALRISLCEQVSAGQPQKFSQAKIIAARNFCNKLWNIGRFVQTATEKQANESNTVSNISLNSPADHWIWQKFQEAKNEIDSNLENYQFAKAWDKTFDFAWNDLADWYLETCKWQLNSSFLSFLFENVLRLLHPFAPFLTEALYQELLSDEKQRLLIDNTWPTTKPENNLPIKDEEVKIFIQTRDLISKARQALPLDLRRQSHLLFKNQMLADRNLDHLCQQLTNISEVSLTDDDKPPGLLINRNTGYEAWIVLDNELLKKHISKLQKEAQTREKLLYDLQRRLDNREYLQKAPAHLVEETRNQLRDLNLEQKTLTEEIENFRQAL